MAAKTVVIKSRNQPASYETLSRIYGPQLAWDISRAQGNGIPPPPRYYSGPGVKSTPTGNVSTANPSYYDRPSNEVPYHAPSVTPPTQNKLTQRGTISRQGEPPWAPRQQYQGEIRRTDVNQQAREQRYQGYAELQAREEERVSGPETTGNFFTQEPKSRGYYETAYGPMGGFMEFGRTSAVTAERSLNPLEWKAGSGFGNVDITNKGFNAAYGNIARNPFSFGGQAAGMGFAFIAPGKVPGMGRLAGMFGKPKTFKVTYLESMETKASNLEFGVSKSGDYLDTGASVRSKTGQYFNSMDTRSLNKLMKEGYPVDMSLDTYGDVFRKTSRPEALKNTIYDFSFGKGISVSKNQFRSVGTMSRVGFKTFTAIETGKPKIPGMVDFQTTGNVQSVLGSFEGMSMRGTIFKESSSPIKIGDDSFRITHMKGKPSGKLDAPLTWKNAFNERHTLDYMKGKDWDFYGGLNPEATPSQGSSLKIDFAPSESKSYVRQATPIAFEEVGNYDYDFFPTPGMKQGPSLHTGGMDMKTLNVFIPSYSGKSNLGLDLNIGTARREKQNLNPSFLYHGRMKEKSGLDMKDILNVGSGLNIGFASRSNQRQNVFSLQKQQQKQRQEQRTGFRMPRVSSPKLGFGLGPSRSGNPFTSGKGFGLSFGGLGHGRVFTKAFFSDLLSVNASMAKYGKATHPALTKKNWIKAESSGFLNVPTVEMGRKSKGKLRRLI